MLSSSPASELFRGWRFLWQARAGHYCAGLVRSCPVEVVVCMDDSPTHELIAAAAGTRFLDVERSRGRVVDDAAIEGLVPAVAGALSAAVRRRSSARWVAAAASTSASLRDFAAANGVLFAANAPALVASLNDKACFLDALAELGLPQLPGRWLRLSAARYPEIAAELGTTFVAQLARGASGSGTAFIASEQDHAAVAARFGDRPVRVAPDLGQLSVNVNALALERSVIVSCPSVQLAGLPLLGADRGMYCGNDFIAARALPGRVTTAVTEQTARVGGWLAARGFRGLYGLDFVVDQAHDAVYAVDLNPRWQGSTTLLTLAEAKAGRLPLAAAELAWRLGALGEDDLRREADTFFAPVHAAHLSLRAPAAGASIVGGSLRPGVYSGAAEFLRTGFELTDCARDDELLVSGGVPRCGARMGPTAHLVRIACERRVLDLSTLQPLPWCASPVAAIYGQLALRPAQGDGAS